MIKQIDEHQNRMSLSIKALESYPGENLEKLEEVMANAESRWEQAQRPSAEVSSPQDQPKVPEAETAPEETTQSEN